MMFVFIKVSVFTIFLMLPSVQAASTSTNAVYNGAWTGVTSGTPGSGQSNTFNATAGNPALLAQWNDSYAQVDLGGSTNTINGDFTVTGGVEADLNNNSINTITGTVRLAGDITGTYFPTVLFSNGTTHITGGVIIEENCSADFSAGSLQTTNNHIRGGITLNGANSSANFSTFRGSITSDIDTVTIGNGNANFSNDRGTANNTIGTITVNGIDGSANFSNNGDAANNTLGTVNLSNGKMLVGGSGATTEITTMNWTGGELDFVYANGGFGTTHIDTLNVTAPVTLGLYDAGAGGYSTSAPSGTQTILTVGTFTGDSSNISLINTSPFTEVLGTSSAPNGISVSADGKVTVTLVPVGTTSDNTTISTVTGAVDHTVTGAIQGMQTTDMTSFAPTSTSNARNVAYMRKTLQENSKNPFEAAVMALSALDGPIVKSSGDYRVCLAPYAARIRNSGIAGASGFTEKTYGVILGGSHYFKSMDANLMFLMGMGASKTQQDTATASNTKGKSLILGAVVTKEIWDKKIDVISSLYGIITQNRQARQGNPSPTQRYVALSRYNTKTSSWQNEAGYVVKFDDGYSVRPKIGAQLLASYRSAFSEQNAGIFAQKYRRQRQYSGEAYTGIGFRKKWNSDYYEGKVTLSYDIGRLSGGRKSNVKVYADSAPAGVSFSQTKPGLTVHYINLYGSLLDKENNWKIAPGASYSFQADQRSLAGTLKLEYRW